MIMGAAAFTGTFASVYAFRAPVQSSIATQPASAPQAIATQAVAQPAAEPRSAAQNCTPRPDGTCQQPVQRGFTYYLLPQFSYGSSASASAAPKPQSAALTGNATAPKPAAQSAALTNNARTSTPTVNASGTTRNGFGTTAQSNSFRVSAGG